MKNIIAFFVRLSATLAFLGALFFGVLFVFCLGSCNDSVDDMLDDYNSKFSNLDLYDSGASPEYELQPGDEGFDQSKMLQRVYNIDDRSLLQLGAPYACLSYEWKIQDKNKQEVSFKIYANGITSSNEITSWTGRTFDLYIPESELLTGTSYKLFLSVRGKDGKLYTCNSTLDIYELLED